MGTLWQHDFFRMINLIQVSDSVSKGPLVENDVDCANHYYVCKVSLLLMIPYENSPFMRGYRKFCQRGSNSATVFYERISGPLFKWRFTSVPMMTQY